MSSSDAVYMGPPSPQSSSVRYAWGISGCRSKRGRLPVALVTGYVLVVVSVEVRLSRRVCTALSRVAHSSQSAAERRPGGTVSAACRTGRTADRNGVGGQGDKRVLRL